MGIKAAELVDLADIYKIEAEAYHPELVTSLSGFQKILRDKSADDFLDAYQGEQKILGFCHYSMNQPEAGDCGVWDIAVAESARGRGVGHALMGRILAQARFAKMKRVWLYVPEDNPAARELYAKNGFVETGRIENYYPPQGARNGDFTVDAIVMHHAFCG